MKGRTLLTGFIAVGFMSVLILDSKTAISSAQAGIEMCVATVIPSLFPFLILSAIITASFTGGRSSLLRLPGKLTGIPSGSESLLLTGWLGGYPIGAQSIYQAYRNGQLKKLDAERMLGFCNNPGPAFIFGITSTIFSSPAIPWIVWGIQILSSLITGILLPGRSTAACPQSGGRSVTVSQAVTQGVRSMGIICGWIVAARVLIGFGERWFLWLLPRELSVLITGVLELSNGCIALAAIASEDTRFVLCCVMLAFGGLCVWMQTISVTGELRATQCITGKVLQTLISLILSIAMCPVLFSETQTSHFARYGLLVLCAVGICLLLLIKKVVALKKKVLYNV